MIQLFMPTFRPDVALVGATPEPVVVKEGEFILVDAGFVEVMDEFSPSVVMVIDTTIDALRGLGSHTQYSLVDPGVD